MRRLWVMVAGPYTEGGRADAARRAANLRALNDAALALLRMGHVPVVGVNMALPVVEAAGGDAAAAFGEVVMPLSLALAARCDGCLRVGGPSRGADEEAATFRADGRPVWRDLSEVPPPSPAREDDDDGDSVRGRPRA